MNPATRVDHIRRMLQEAQACLGDAEILNAHPDKASNADYLLELLAFEILLKATLQIHCIGVDLKHHRYHELFTALPAEVQDRLITRARSRMTDSADYSDVPALLTLFGKNFINFRYPYDKYRDQSDEEVGALSTAWVARVAPEKQADFQYRPLELFGLNDVLQSEVEKWCNAPSDPLYGGASAR